ncbi:hypothetical protein MRX96_038342 [Rhipicephalus microplus]
MTATDFSCGFLGKVPEHERYFSDENKLVSGNYEERALHHLASQDNNTVAGKVYTVDDKMMSKLGREVLQQVGSKIVVQWLQRAVALSAGTDFYAFKYFASMTSTTAPQRKAD